jgi:hypothetical protein
MDFEPSYGSSEYSAQAESVFAQYLLQLEEGTAPDFEAFCANHEDWADELYGLHADWDNVRGLLAQLQDRREASGTGAPSPVPDSEEEKDGHSQPESASPIEAPETSPPATRSHWRTTSVVALITALALGSWILDLRESSRVLAQDKMALTMEQEEQRQELELVRKSEELLAIESSALRLELDTTLSEKQELKGRSDGLARDLKSEREAKSALELDKQGLARELEKERERQEIASAEAALMTARLEARDCIERELGLWPATTEMLPLLEEWLEEAGELSTKLEELRPESSDGTAAEPGPGQQLKRSMARIRQRLEALETWGSGGDGIHSAAWEEARRRIGDHEEFPIYDGLNLTPQFELVPLGVDPSSGLWTFADLQTGDLPQMDENGQFQLEESSAMILYLVPGISLEGASLEAFFVAGQDCTVSQRSRALGALAKATVGGSQLQAELQYELDLARLGYEELGMSRADLARQSGLELGEWRRLPVRPLRTGN